MKKITLLCYGCLIAAALQAQIIHVPADYSTIQLGINAATPGDTVLVADGLYYEQINFLGKKPLMVASEFLMDGDTSHISNTIIDGSQAANPDNASVVYFISGEDTTSVLCGFTIRNGQGTRSAAGIIQGGGIWISGSGAMIKNNRITGNKCEAITPSTNTGCYGGGIGVNSSQTSYWVVIRENRIDSNSVVTDKPTAKCIGGGLACGANARIINNRINFNLAKRTVISGSVYAFGGGIYLGSPWAIQTMIIGNTVMGNQVSGNYSIGGGIYCEKALLTCSHNVITDNHVGTTTSITNLGGGGMEANHFLPGSTISNNLFKGNSSESWSGGLHIEYFVTTNLFIWVENNYFIENHADAWGGAFGSTDCRLMLVNNVFSHNEAFQGGVGYIDQSTLIPDEHTAWLINNTFCYNKGIFSNGSLDFMRSNPMLMNCIFWQNEAPNIPGINATAGFSEIAFSDIDTTEIGGIHYVGPGIIFADPLFNDTINLIPEPFSPCVDAGVASYTCIHGDTCYAPLYDFTGAPRPVGNGYDMGAYDLTFSGVGIHSIVKARLPFSVQPNPFSAFTTFSYKIEESSLVLLQVFDSYGRLVDEPVNAFQTNGEHYLQWNSGKLPSGIYYCRLTSGKQVMSRKIIKMN
jgi:hypothetical protein